MKHNTFKLVAIAAVFMLPLSLFAQITVIDDFEDGNSQNNLGELYWYFYADENNGGESEILSAIHSGGRMEFEGEYTPGYESEFSGKLEYDLDDRDTIEFQVDPYVAMGTNLAPEGESIDLSEGTEITFWARADAEMNVRVKLEMASVTGDNKYQMQTGDTYGIPVTTTWTQYTMALSDGLGGLTQEDWGPSYDYEDIDLTTVTNLVFEIKGEGDNPDQGTFWVDDVILHGVELAPSDVCVECQGEPGTGTGALFSSFEGDWPTANALEYYWYCYNDAGGRSLSEDDVYSDIFEGVAADSDPEEPTLEIDGNGYDGTAGAHIGFQFGEAYEDNGNTIPPFVGLGTMVSDNFGLETFDAEAIGATGIYFDYKTDENTAYISFEIEDALNRGIAGLVHSVKLPGTEGVWKSATVSFDDMNLPNWEEVNQLRDDEKALSTTELTKMQWKVSGTQGEDGSLALDNVYLLGAPADAFNSPVRNGFSVAGGAMRVNQVNGTLRLALEPKAHDVNMSIISPQGRLVAKRTVSAGSNTATMPVNNLADGVYLIKITGLDNRSFSVPMTIVK